MLSYLFCMTDESFLLVSLEEEKSKKLAQVLSNDTARKILDFMSSKEHITETEVSKDLKIPLSTAHYNLGLLVKANLINDDHYTYSKKGKKINHYSLSNKYVIIAPKKSNILKEKLKEFLPVLLLGGLSSLAIKYFYYPMAKLNTFATRTMGDMAVEESAMLADTVPKSIITSNNNIALWFFLGCLFAVFINLILSIIKKRNNQ